MGVVFPEGATRQEVFETIQSYLDDEGLKIVSKDFNRPWGGFFVIDEGQAQKFSDLFFKEVNLNDLKISGKLSPKILVVQPGKRLSWQYHYRRAEIWKLIAGEAGIITSPTDTEGVLLRLKIGDIVRLNCGERHRLVGLQKWGMLSEIWQHTDAALPSDEEDIVRVQDDFGR
jgi:mannose-6-phosphate isomerase